MKKKLRVAVLTNSDTVPAWAYRMLELVATSKYAEIVLIVENEAGQVSKSSLLERLRRNFGTLLYILFNKFEQRLKNVSPDAFLERKLGELLPDVSRLLVRPEQKKFSDYIAPGDIEKIRAVEPDVMIRLGFRILRGEILTCARHGVWSFHHGDNRMNRGGPAGFWEVFEHWSSTGSTLQILTEDLDAGAVLYRSQSLTDSLLVGRNKNNLYWKSLSIFPRMLERLWLLGADEFFKEIDAKNQHPEFYARRLYTNPTNSEMLRLAVRHYWVYLRAKIRNIFYFDQWILLFSFKNNDQMSTSFWRFKQLTPPKDRFWADPFILLRDGTYYIFLEELLYSRGRGHISYMTLDKSGQFSQPVPVIEEAYHLSYPFVFEHDNEHYMIPESSDNRSIDLYKCTRFPDRWEHAHTLMDDISAVDATVLSHEDRWWMFVNIRENEGASSSDELFLFYSTSLFSKEWVPHPANPIVSDVGNARPAGKIFMHNGQMYRPSQNGSHRYGYGIRIQHIELLSETGYRERCISDIEPEWDTRILATHTINYEKGLTVIDAQLKRSRLFS